LYVFNKNGIIVSMILFYNISGAHFNPSVTIGIFLINKISFIDVIVYIVAQITGGFIGILKLFSCFICLLDV
jgi:glycerol uptake facilitator-like aquaporin